MYQYFYHSVYSGASLYMTQQTNQKQGKKRSLYIRDTHSFHVWFLSLRYIIPWGNFSYFPFLQDIKRYHELIYSARISLKKKKKISLRLVIKWLSPVDVMHAFDKLIPVNYTLTRNTIIIKQKSINKSAYKNNCSRETHSAISAMKRITWDNYIIRVSCYQRHCSVSILHKDRQIYILYNIGWNFH